MTDPDRREYAGPVSRTCAFLTDAAVVTLAATGATVVIVLTGYVVDPGMRDVARELPPILVLVLPALLAGYNAFFWTLAGRTPGMAVLGVRVVTTAGRPVSWLPSLVRALVLAYFPIGAVWCLVDRRRQALHDKLARTTVVRV